MVEKFLFFRKWNKKHIWDEGEDRACPQYSALRTMTMQYFFCYYRIFFGVETAGAKTPFESFKFFKIFYENRCIQIQCGDCYHFTHLVRWLPPPPKGRPRGGWVTKNLKKLHARHASYRSWTGGPSYKRWFTWFGCEPNRFMSFFSRFGKGLITRKKSML